MAHRIDRWMPLDIGDYLGATGKLSTEAHGAYLLILMDYWRNGPPLDDDEELATLARLSLAKWKRHRPAIIRAGKIEIIEGKWRQKRADGEREKALGISKKRKETGKKGADKRWQDDGKPIANAIENEWQTDRPLPIPIPVPLQEVGGGTRARDPAERVLALLPANAVIVNMSRLDTWLRQGFDPDLDILPAISEVVARHPPDWAPYSLDYFDKPIARAHAMRTKPIPEVSNDIPKFLDRRTENNPDSFIAGAMRAASRGRA